jgi:hypothetical protein
MIVEKRKTQLQKRRKKTITDSDACVFKEEVKKVILKFERVFPSRNSQIGWNKIGEYNGIGWNTSHYVSFHSILIF